MAKQKKTKNKATKEPTIKQKRAMAVLVENGGNVSAAMKAAGYSPAMAKNPQKFKKSLGFKELAEQMLPDAALLQTHQALLNSHKLDHMVFPLGPLELQPEVEDDEHDEDPESREMEEADRTSLTDGEIISMLSELGCSVRRIVHGRTARHVYFWAPETGARQKALELGYKVRGKLKDPAPLVPFQINFDAIREKYSTP